MFNFLLPAYFSLLISVSLQQQIRTWIPNTNFDDRKNWLNMHVPCESTSAVFPSDLFAAVYMPKVVKVKEIVFPDNGELLLRQDSKIDITGSNSSPTCNQTVSQFRNINIESWLNPRNWKSEIENNAIPHTERVPCMFDDVVFPNDSSFWVEYPDVPVSVNRFQIEGKNLTNKELQLFLLSEPGSRQFKNKDYQFRTDVITIQSAKCTSKRGCRCHNYNNYIRASVCRHVKICPIAHCLNPVKPYGHCCEFCGAYLDVLATDDFDLSKFKKQVEHLVLTPDLNIHVSTESIVHDEGCIQVVVREKGDYRGYSVSAATTLHDNILENLKLFKIEHVSLRVSGAEYWPEAQLKTTVGIVLGTLAAVLVALVALYVIYGPLQEKGLPFKLPFSMPSMATLNPFLFVRFENSGDTDGGLEFRNRSVASSLFNLDRAFDNPLYGEPLPSTSQATEELGTETTERMEFKNPMFSELKKQESLDVEE